MKKRILACLLAAAMAATLLAGCGNSNGDTNGGADGGADNGANGDANGGGEEQIQITMIMAQRDEWLSELEASAKANAGDNIKFDTQDAQSDAAKQMQQIEAARNKGADAIIVNLVDPETAAEMKEAAGDSKVVFVNRYPADPSVLDENAIYVGSDESSAGVFQGEFLTEYCKANNMTELRYVMLNGILGQTSTTNRTAAVLKTLEDNGITPIPATAHLACEYDRAEAMDKFSPLIGTIEYDVIISNSDGMTLGAIEALELKGLDPAEKPIVSIDASKDGRVAIKEGKLTMSVFQNPIGQGRGAVMAAYNMAVGNDIAQDTGYEKDETGFVLWVPFEPVTIDNVADYD